jgi:hypothetical protein
MYIHPSGVMSIDMEISVHTPDDLAGCLGTADEIERRALEALALEDKFLRVHEAYGLAKAARKRAEPAKVAPDEARRAKARQAAANIIARGKGVRLGGIKITDLI